jgi:hypothetical protein
MVATLSFDDFLATVQAEENFPEERVTARNFLAQYPHWQASATKPWYELEYRGWAVTYSSVGWEYSFNGITCQGDSLVDAKLRHHAKYQAHLA